MDIITPERVCYVHCNLCNTILAVSVPSSSSSGGTTINIVTVRCGHCANLLSVNISSLLGTLPLPAHQEKMQKPQNLSYVDANVDGASSSSKDHKFNGFKSVDHEGPRLSVIRPPQKRQRVPSAYNRFIKEEIQRIKAGNPEISHREAFSTAAKNWAHFPHIHFGLKLDGTSM